LLADQQAVLQQQKRALDKQKRVLWLKQQQRKVELSVLRSEAKKLRREVAILARQRATQEKLLAEKLVSNLVYFNTLREVNAISGELDEVVEKADRARQAIAEAAAKIAELEAGLRDEALDEMGKVRAELAEVEQSIVQAEDRVSRLRISELETFALRQRPELRVEDYNERISGWESREALLGMFPSLDLNLTRNFSTDAGLVNTSWSTAGAALGMDLFRLFSGPFRMQAAEQRGELARRMRLSMSVAVLAQVHIAYHEYREANYQFRLARRISHADRELSDLAIKERSITQGNVLDSVDGAARQLRSEVEQHRAYVELRRTHGNMLHSLGLDVIPAEIPLHDVDRLRTAIRTTVAKWETLTEDADAAGDGSIEELVGQVLADLRPGGAASTATEKTHQIASQAAPEAPTVPDVMALAAISPAAGAATDPFGDPVLPSEVDADTSTPGPESGAVNTGSFDAVEPPTATSSAVVMAISTPRPPDLALATIDGLAPPPASREANAPRKNRRARTVLRRLFRLCRRR
jgi:hypothetical protein